MAESSLYDTRDEQPLWTTSDPDAPDDGWLLTRPAPANPPPRRREIFPLSAARAL